MTNAELMLKVQEIITAAIPNKPSYLLLAGTGETLENLGFDSLDRHEIALKIEQEFSIDIEDGVPEAWTTVQDVIDSVVNEIGASPANYAQPAINRIERADVKTFAAGAVVCNEIGATMSEVALQNLEELCGRGERDTLRSDGDNR